MTGLREYNQKSTIKYLYFPFATIAMNDLLAAASSRTGKWSPYNNLKKKTEQAIGALAKSQMTGTIKGLHHWKYIWLRTNRRKDPGNIASAEKFFPDALQTVNIIANDGWSTVGRISHLFGIHEKDALWLEISPYKKSETPIGPYGTIFEI